MSDQPNLLFVFADQLRARDIDDAAHPLLTPAYDRLRAEGLRLTDMVANCPVCTPSRAMLLTGQYPLANRVVANDLPLPDDAPTIGERLRDGGYRTGYVGKWHLDGVPRNRFTPPGPRRHGFDFWAVHNCSHAYLHGGYYRDSPELLQIPGYEPVFQTDLCLDFLSRDDARPFALFLSWGPPHDPYADVPEEYQRLYDPATLPYPANFESATPRLDPPGGALRPVDLSRDPRRSLAQYYAHITALDAQLDRLLDALDRAGQAENTVVVYTSDHGDMLFSHGRMLKQQPWEESVRVPCVVRWPGHVSAGADRDAPASIADLAPTLLSLLGLDPLPAAQGDDLAPLLLGRTTETRESSFLLEPVTCDQSWSMDVPPWRGVRTRRHTYVRTHAGPWLLYDNLADPEQLCNLVDHAACAATQRALEAELASWMRRLDDSFETGEAILRRLGLERLWDDRERELHGPRARLLG
jgi:arylsulfatase A-like enzyme